MSRIKPGAWAISPKLVDPRWRRYWEHHVASWMAFEESGKIVTPLDDGLDLRGSFGGNAARVLSPFGGAVTFDGAGDSILLGDVPVNHRLQLLSGGTVVAVLRPSSIGDNFARIIDKSDGANGVNGWAVCINSVGNGSMFVRLNGVTDGDSSPGVLINDIWQAIAVSWTPNGPTFFTRLVIDGRWFHEQNENVSAASNAQAPIRIGAWNHTEARFFEGDMALVSVYDRVFSVSERRALLEDPFGLFRPARRLTMWVPVEVEEEEAPSGGGDISPTGVLSLTGTLFKSVFRLLSGSIAPSGTTTKQINKAFAGTVTPTGTLSTIRIFLLALAGTLSLTGTVLKSTSKSFSGTTAPTGALIKTVAKTYTGVLNTTGVIVKSVNKLFTGSLTSSGTVQAIRLALLAVAGTLSLAGTLILRPEKVLSGTLSTSGALTRQTDKVLAGTLTPAGTITKSSTRTFAGTLNFSGAFSTIRVFLISLAGSLGLSGILTRRPEKVLSGTVSSSGTMSKMVGKQLSGTLSFSGTHTKLISKVLAGLLGLAGTAATFLAGSEPPRILAAVITVFTGHNRRATIKRDDSSTI